MNGHLSKDVGKCDMQYVGNRTRNKYIGSEGKS